MRRVVLGDDHHARRAAIEPVTRATAPLDLMFGAPQRFIGREIVVLPLTPHGPLRALHEALKASGIRYETARWPFTPHATLNFYATLTHFENAPVFIEVRCEYATLRLEDDLVVIDNDGRGELLAEQDSIGTARSYWGASHERLIRDFYAHLQDQRHFWIDSNEAMKSLHIAKAFYSKEAQ